MKTCRIGNDIVFVIPESFGIEEGIDYLAIKDQDESIIFIKKKSNFIEDAFDNESEIDVGTRYIDDAIGREEI